MEAIVLAGGLGKRLRSAVPDLPKPMAPIAGRPFLEHQLDYWEREGVTRAILAVSYMADKIQDHFGNRYDGVELDYSVETEPLGTGGGLLLALEKLRDKDESFLVLNGDTFFEVKLDYLLTFHRAKQADLTLSLHSVDANDRYSGIDLAEDGRVESIRKRESGQGKMLVNGGAYLAKASLFTEALGEKGPRSLEDDLMPQWLKSRKNVYGFISTGRFIDIGVPEDYAAAEGIIREVLS
ncbi:MAG: NTP transferase domain-containing protein [Bdellovibrionaceae bacterium]|nr:nucleotidyltransferase family protein [Bdellovibrionales bacterium]MCB9254428.1 NTP transferase domain-containing protein [Pseudobdellovibrionaceae bacterium]